MNEEIDRKSTITAKDLKQILNLFPYATKAIVGTAIDKKCSTMMTHEIQKTIKVTRFSSYTLLPEWFSLGSSNSKLSSLFKYLTLNASFVIDFELIYFL